MAEFEFKKHDREKIKPKIKSKRMFVTGSSRTKGTDTFLTSSYEYMSASFASNEYLDDSGIWESQGALIYQLQNMKDDIDDLHAEISSSVYVAQVSEFSSIATGSFGNISSSLIPNTEDKYNLGSSSREWHTSYMLTASIGGGIFTSASLAEGGGGTADFSSVGEDIIPDSDNTRDLGSKTKEFKNLYIDGVAYIDSLAGTTLTAPIRHVFNQVTAMKTTTLDASGTDVFEFNIAKAVTIDLITPAFIGQEITIINIGSGAITVTRSAKGKQTSIYGQSNLTINQHEAYKFVFNSNSIWYVIS
jgi:hypothetical protein|tara:strand:+ start:410 stop:1318 length:909 start_codon:yes stop_codon:yes gene_type:complete